MALLYGSLAYMAGILIGRAVFDRLGVRCPLPEWLWLVPLGLLPLCVLLHRRNRARSAAAMRWPASAGFEPDGPPVTSGMVLMVALCAAAGALRYAGHPFTPCWTPADLAYYNLPADQAFERNAPDVTLFGFVDSYPLVADVKQRLMIRVHTIEIDGVQRAVTGNVRLNTGIRERYRYGQPVRVTGRLATPPDFDSFSFREYLARKGIHSLLYTAAIETIEAPPQGNPLLAALYAVRARGERFLNRALPEPYAALANGMLLGIESGIPDELYDQFNATGSSHVIVISGSNVALVAGVILALMTRLVGGSRAVWLTVAGIAGYALLVGGDAAVMRAGVMGSLAVVAAGMNRRSTALVSLGTACALMTLLNPLALWDVGLQLSSAATAGLILVAPDLIAAFRKALSALGLGALSRGPVGSFFEESLMVTLAANLTTMPLVVYYFGRLSMVSLFTNLLILPAQPPIMLAGSAGTVAGIAGLEPLGRLILLVPWLCLTWTVHIVRWTASLPGASLEIAGYSTVALVVTYLALAGVKTQARWRALFGAIRQWKAAEWGRRLVTPAAATGLAMATVLAWAAVASLPDGRLHLWFLDVGQGDGIFIQTPSGRQVLIDGGASPEKLFSGLGAVMPFWDRTLDLLVLTHPDSDHMLAQTEVPLRYQVHFALYTPHAAQHPDAAPWQKRMLAHDVTIVEQTTGGWLDLGDGVALWVLWPPPEGIQAKDVDNEHSLVLKLVYGDFSALLTGDAGLPSEEAMTAQASPLQATLLKVGHHGSRTGTSKDFVEYVAAQVAVIQVGADNDYGHPHPEVLSALDGRMVLRTDQHGRVHVQSDGRQMWIETAR